MRRITFYMQCLAGPVTQTMKGDCLVPMFDTRIDYKAEVLPGDLLEVRAALTRIGGKSLTVAYEMINLGNGEVAATLECVMVLFDWQKRKSVTIPDDLRAKAESFLEEHADSS